MEREEGGVVPPPTTAASTDHVDAPPPVRLWGDSGQEEMLRQREAPGGAAAAPLPYPLTDFFDISDTIATLSAHAFRKVALQFPDELLPYAPEVYRRLQAGLGRDVMVFVLGDTSYGACCVDEVAAQHLGADVVVHYGRTCLSPTSHLPVLYVFGRKAIDIDAMLNEFQLSFPLVDGRIQDLEEDERVIVYYDVEYAHAIPQAEKRLREAGYSSDQVVISQVHRIYLPDQRPRLASKPQGGTCGSCDCSETPTAEEPATTNSESNTMAESTAQRVVYGRRIPESRVTDDKKRDTIVFIGEEGPTLTNFLITYNQAKIWRFSPETSTLRRETLSMNKTLMRRYFLVEKTKDADIIGIVAGTLGVSKYLQIIDHMKSLIKAAGKKYYTFVVGKLNPHKLANFEHIDVFVLVACPENSIIDSKEFFKPIATPFELELALTKGKQWTGEYITDFSEVLPSLAPAKQREQSKSAEKENEEEEEEIDDGSESDEEEVRISLIDGKIKHTYRPDSNGSVPGQELVVSGGQTLAVAVPTAASFLAQREWKGLEQKLGETEVRLAEEGRAGIPKGYTHSENQDRKS